MVELYILKSNVTELVAFAPQAPHITSSASVFNASGAAFTYQIVATNTPTAYYVDWLPYELSLDSVTGIISGTTWLNSKAVYDLTIHAVNEGGVGTQPLRINIS